MRTRASGRARRSGTGGAPPICGVSCRCGRGAGNATDGLEKTLGLCKSAGLPSHPASQGFRRKFVNAEALDVPSLLEPAAESDPCGPDLEYERRFTEMEEAAEGRPERQIGDVVEPAEPPDWQRVRDLAQALLGESKDLRPAVHLAKAWLHLRGIAGLAAGLRLVGDLIERYWDCIHPQLDPEDDYDPTIRLNTLADLADPATVLRAVAQAPLLCAKGLGCFSVEDWEVAMGRRAPEAETEQEPPSTDWIGAIFQAAGDSEVAEAAGTVSHALEQLRRIARLLQSHVEDPGLLPDFERLSGLLEEALHIFELHAPAAEAGAAQPDEQAPHDVAARAETGEPRSLAQIRSPDDVIKALDAIRAYYEQNEPSSPIPILMARAKRLVRRDFLAIIRNVAPDALRQIEELRGPEDEDQ